MMADSIISAEEAIRETNMWIPGFGAMARHEPTSPLDFWRARRIEWVKYEQSPHQWTFKYSNWNRLYVVPDDRVQEFGIVPAVLQNATRSTPGLKLRDLFNLTQLTSIDPQPTSIDPEPTSIDP